jgi:ribulose-5-phosphate 4-epimerase/fuculose-1-phosphate aldolase
MDFTMKGKRSDSPTSFPMSAEERTIRRDLAAAYRLFAHFGMDDLLANHLTAKVPHPGGDAFLINPLGLMFEEVTASSLIKINLAGEILQEALWNINRAGFVIHSAVHAGCPHARSVMHLHGRAGVAVSATKEGLLPLNQTAIALCGNIAFHDYEGPATNDAEKVRLVSDLGEKRLMLLRNHGTLSIGESVAEAFYRLYNLEWACDVQVRTLGMGRPLYAADSEVIEKTSLNFSNEPKHLDYIRRYTTDLFWPAMLRKLDRVNPGYAD